MNAYNDQVDESPINIQPLPKQLRGTPEAQKKPRKVRKDFGIKRPGKPHTIKRITNIDIVNKFEDINVKVASVMDMVNKLGEYYPQPAAEMSLPDKIDYVGMEKIPPNKQLVNSMSESESFRNATNQVFKQFLIPTGNLNSGGLVWM